MDISIGKKNIGTQRFTQYKVERSENHISVSDPMDKIRLAGHMTISPDQIDLAAAGRRYQIKMGPEGVTVENPATAGTRGAYDMVVATPLKPEQYESTGLSVAFALLGLPVPPQLLSSAPSGESSSGTPLQIHAKNAQGTGRAAYEVRQEGPHMIVTDPKDRMYRGSLDLSRDDQISLYADQREYRIQMGPEGVTVDNPKEVGMRAGMKDLVLPVALKTEEYRRVGLSVAFSLLGLPIPPHLAG